MHRPVLFQRNAHLGHSIGTAYAAFFVHAPRIAPITHNPTSE